MYMYIYISLTLPCFTNVMNIHQPFCLQYTCVPHLQYTYTVCTSSTVHIYCMYLIYSTHILYVPHLQYTYTVCTSSTVHIYCMYLIYSTHILYVPHLQYTYTVCTSSTVHIYCMYLIYSTHICTSKSSMSYINVNAKESM